MRYASRQWMLPAFTVGLVALTAPVVAVAGAPAATPSPANAHLAGAVSAGNWLATQLVDGGIPGFVGVDWGLTIDVLVALRATGADPEAAEAAADAIEGNVDAYATGGEWAPELRIAGATAKVLYAAAVAGRDPAAFGGSDLRQRTMDLVAGPETGAQNGWLKSRDGAALTDGVNMFEQSIAVLGLARSGGVPPPMVAFLIGQQCPAGGFRLFPPADGAPCAAAPADQQVMDPDTTGLAVQALLAAGTADAGAAVDKAVGWLLSVQQLDGAFHGSALTDYSNANSTGLAGQALAAAGHAAAGDRAAGWIASQQLTAADAGAAVAAVGAIAYTPEVRADAVANGIAEFALDQWRRSTAQAVLALAKVPLGQVGIVAPPPAPAPSTSTAPSTAPSTSSSHPTAAPAPVLVGAGDLAATGPPVARLVATGGLAVLLGVALLLASRRRRDRTP